MVWRSSDRKGGFRYHGRGRGGSVALGQGKMEFGSSNRRGGCCLYGTAFGGCIDASMVGYAGTDGWKTG